MMASRTPILLADNTVELQKGETKICSDKVCCEFDLDYERLAIPEDKVILIKKIEYITGYN